MPGWGQGSLRSGVVAEQGDKSPTGEMHELHTFAKVWAWEEKPERGMTCGSPDMVSAGRKLRWCRGVRIWLRKESRKKEETFQWEEKKQ